MRTEYAIKWIEIVLTDPQNGGGNPTDNKKALDQIKRLAKFTDILTKQLYFDSENNLQIKKNAFTGDHLQFLTKFVDEWQGNSPF